MPSGFTIPRLKARPELDLLDVDIVDWQWEQSYGLNPFEDPYEFYLEGRLLSVVGKTLGKKFETLKVDLTFYMAEPIDYKRPRLEPLPEWVGDMRRVKGGYVGNLSLPERAAPMVVTSLAAGKYETIRFQMLRRSRLTYDVHDFRFRREFKQEHDDDIVL